MGFKAEGGVTVTDAMLDAWADAAERGDYPGLGGDGVAYSGRIPPTDAESEAETVRAVGPPGDPLATARAGLGTVIWGDGSIDVAPEVAREEARPLA